MKGLVSSVYFTEFFWISIFNTCSYGEVFTGVSPIETWTPVPVRVSVAPSPSVFGQTGQGDGVRGSADCCASLRSADYDHDECQAQ